MQKVRGLTCSHEYFMLCDLCGFIATYEPNNGPITNCQKCKCELDDRKNTVITNYHEPLENK